MMTGPAESVHNADGTLTMVWRRHYPDPVDDVWSAVTESERLGRWIGTWTGVPRVGGSVAFTMTGEVDAGGEVSAPFDVAIRDCVPPHRLVVTFPSDDPAGAWDIEITLEEVEGATLLVFAQHFDDGRHHDDIDAGWRWYLDRLGASLRGAPMPPWEASPS